MNILHRLNQARAEMSWLLMLSEHLKNEEYDLALQMVESEIENQESEIKKEEHFVKSQVTGIIRLSQSDPQMKKELSEWVNSCRPA